MKRLLKFAFWFVVATAVASIAIKELATAAIEYNTLTGADPT
jgi:hypothetical protein